MIILKVTKQQGFTLSLEDKFLKKPQGGQIDFPLSCLRVNESSSSIDKEYISAVRNTCFWNDNANNFFLYRRLEEEKNIIQSKKQTKKFLKYKTD